jgi:hypothetical protein
MAALTKQQAQYRSLAIPFDRNHRYHLSLASFPQFYDEAVRLDRPMKTKIYRWTRGDAGKSHQIHSAERGTKIILAAANRSLQLRLCGPREHSAWKCLPTKIYRLRISVDILAEK